MNRRTRPWLTGPVHADPVLGGEPIDPSTSTHHVTLRSVTMLSPHEELARDRLCELRAEAHDSAQASRLAALQRAQRRAVRARRLAERRARQAQLALMALR
jgi:hypothetical protein